MPKLFDILDDIRVDHTSDVELYKIIKKQTSFKLEPLKLMLKDISFYLFVEKEKKLATIKPEVVQAALKKLEEQGLTEEDLIKEGYIKVFKVPKTLTEPLGVEEKLTIDEEALLYPFEFYYIKHLYNMVLGNIRKLEPNFNPNNTNNKKQTNKAKSADKKNTNSAITKTTQPTFENSISLENQKFILQLMEELSITKNGKCNISARKKSYIRGMVQALIVSGHLPKLAIHTLCNIIGNKIGLEINSKLEYTATAIDAEKEVKNYIKNNK
jgi:DNA-binding transcriptional ArsR family regulator